MEPSFALLQGQSKAEWREALLKALGARSAQTNAEESARLGLHLKDWVATRAFDVVLGTFPMDGEPNLVPFYEVWLSSGRKLALARTERARRLSFRYVSSLEGPWETKSWGLKEPPAGFPEWQPGPSTLCLVPGLAFGSPEPGGVPRLGRGGGYYDRWLSQFADHVYSLGVGFSIQGVSGWPIEDHDQPLDDRFVLEPSSG